jgi:hypothetical protein
MATHSFGTNVNPGFFVEIADAANPGQTKRPPAGTTLKVRSAADLSALPDVVTGLYGYWGTTTTDIPEIQVSGDGGSTWSKSLQSVEALSATIAAGAVAALALTTANSATGIANSAASSAAAAQTAAAASAAAAAAAVAGGGGAGGFTWANAPANALGIVIKNEGAGTWPARPSARTDISFMFLGTSPGPAVITSGTAGYYAGVDVILEKPAA